MEGMLVPELAVLVVMQSRHHNAPAGAAAGGGGKGIKKQGSVGSQGVDMGCPRHLVAITAERGALVVGDEEDDVLLGSKRRPCEQGE